MPSLADLRKEYTLAVLDEASIDADPIRQFSVWIDQSLEAKLPEPYAMTLATATAEGRPSARIVLLRGVDERGFAFFTNYESRKGRELRRQSVLLSSVLLARAGTAGARRRARDEGE